MVIEVPRLKDIATDVKLNLQDRLNGVTEILSRVSKLVTDDLDKAVSSTVGQDKEGNQSPAKSPLKSAVFSGFPFSSRFSSGQEASPCCGSQSSCLKSPWWEGGSQCL